MLALDRDAEEVVRRRLEQPELFDGDVHPLQVLVADEMPKIGSTSPATLEGTSVVLDLHVANADVVFGRALDAGATEIYPLADQFYGDRARRVRDPFGHHWIIATRLREVPEEEMVAAFKAMFQDT